MCPCWPSLGYHLVWRQEDALKVDGHPVALSVSQDMTGLEKSVNFATNVFFHSNCTGVNAYQVSR